jgi:hypothetical protein
MRAAVESRASGSVTSLRVGAAVFAVSLLAAGAATLFLGQDYNFDLLNYHYYVGYAFVHGRLTRDVAPGGIQTYQAPFIHVFHYLGMAHLPPRVFGFLLGALHGLAVPVVFLLAQHLQPPSVPRRLAVSLLVAAVAGIGPNAVSMLGCTFGDNLVALPWLAALLLLVGPSETAARPPGGRRLFAAGLLAGAASGLKLTMAAYHLALLPAVFFAGTGRGRRWRDLGWFLFGSAAGFVPTGGLWALRLYLEFGNPLFPFANGLFRSEYFAPRSFGREVYATRTLGDVVRPIFDAAVGRHERLQEISLRDLRFLLILVAGLIWAAAGVVRRLPQPERGLAPRAGDSQRLAPGERALLACWTTGYLLWIALFPYYRYLTPLEIAAPLVLMVLLRRLVGDRGLLPAIGVAALLLAVTTNTGSWGRRSWESTWLRLDLPAIGLQRQSLVLLVGQPIAFVAPSFGADATFVHLTAVDGFGADAKWRQRIDSALAVHSGPVLLLSNFQFPRAAAEARAAELGFTPVACEPVRRGPLRFRLCEMSRRR